MRSKLNSPSPLKGMLLCFHGVLIAVFLGSPILNAQPSAGPHGPVKQTYSVPPGVRAFFVSPEGDAKSEGTTAGAPTSLASAVARARTGDHIILRGGTYRAGSLTFNQGIVFQPFSDESPVITGTEVASEWTKINNGLWKTSWKKLFPDRPQSWWDHDWERARTPLYLFNNDMVFIDGVRLRTAGWPGDVRPDSFCIDYERGEVVIGTDPTGRLVEITAHLNGIVQTAEPINGVSSDGRGLRMRGVALHGYARCAIDVLAKEAEGKMDASLFGKDITDVMLENVSITHCGIAGAYLRGDRVHVKNCLFTDTDSENLYVISSADGIVERSIFKRANVEAMTGHYPSAMKIFNQTSRFICRDNVVVDQKNANGIWYDVGHVDAIVLNNYVEKAQTGFFLEISNGGVCAGNVFVDCESGVMLMNSKNGEVYHNTFVNSPLVIYRYGRVAEGDTFGWHAASGPGLLERKDHVVAGNLFVSNETFRRPFVRLDQPIELGEKLTTFQVQRFDHNTYIRVGRGEPTSLIDFLPLPNRTKDAQFADLEALRAIVPQFEKGSRFFPQVQESPFSSWERRVFSLATPLPAVSSVDSLPVRVREWLGWTAEDASTPGAYPGQRAR